MLLKTVTMTGADDRTDIEELLQLSNKYPFVEWGILVSESSAGRARFPQRTWIRDLVSASEDAAFKPQLSLHLCGRWLRQFLKGLNDVAFELGEHIWRPFRRVQLNLHGSKASVFPAEFHELILREVNKQFIFQIDGADGGRLLQNFYEETEAFRRAVPFFDVSHGAGVSPSDWPSPEFDDGQGGLVFHGYGGGIGPDNIVEEIKRIDAAAGDCSTWIDMETKVRTGEVFDLNLVRECLAIVSPFVAR